MQNNQNPPRVTIKEALDQLFERQQANGPPPPGYGTLEKYIEILFIEKFKLQPDVPFPVLSEHPVLFNRPPGKGAELRDWSIYWAHQDELVMTGPGRVGKDPLYVIGWVVMRLTSEEKANLVEAISTNYFRRFPPRV